MSRSAILPGSELVALETWSRCTEIIGETMRKPVDALDPVFYASMFQSGVDRISVLSTSTKCKLQSTVKTRLDFIGATRLPQSALTVYKHLVGYVSPAKNPKENNERIILLACYMASIAAGMAFRQPIVLIQPPPDLQKLHNLLPAGVIQVISHFLRSLSLEECSMPMPRLYAERKAYKRLEQIICSDLFSQYQVSHTELEDATGIPAIAVRDIERNSLKLVKLRYSGLVTKKGIITLLTITPMIIDSIFGKLPGTIATVLGDLASKLIEDKRRFLFYNANQICEDHFRTQLERVCQVANSSVHADAPILPARR